MQKSMKSNFFFAAWLLLASVAQAQPVSIYQPPTPAAKMNITATPGAQAQGIAVDQFLNQYVRLYGNAPAFQTAVPVEITPIAQSVMLPTALPTLFPVTPNALVNSAALSAVTIDNQFNIDLNCSFGAAAATPLPFTVPAGTAFFYNLARDGKKLSTGVSCIHPGAATPASGTMQVWGY